MIRSNRYYFVADEVCPDYPPVNKRPVGFLVVTRDRTITMWSDKSGRTSPLPKAWKMIRANVLKRDRYMCVQVREDTGLPCGAPATDVDHGDLGPDNHTHANLRSLCRFHHNQKTAAQGGTAAGQRFKRPKHAEAHPGFLPVDD